MKHSRYIVMPAVRASDVGEGFADGQALSPNDMLFPLPPCLPMGFSCSLFFAQTTKGGCDWPRHVLHSLEGSPTGLELIEDPGFMDVPHEMLDPKDWETLCGPTLQSC